MPPGYTAPEFDPETASANISPPEDERIAGRPARFSRSIAERQFGSR